MLCPEERDLPTLKDQYDEKFFEEKETLQIPRSSAASLDFGYSVAWSYSCRHCSRLETGEEQNATVGLRSHQWGELSPNESNGALEGQGPAMTIESQQGIDNVGCTLVFEIMLKIRNNE